MRLLFVSDIHAHLYQTHSRPMEGGMNTRLHHTVGCIKIANDYAKKNGIDRIIFGGDMFNVPGKIDVVTFNAVFEAVARSKVHWYMIPGNHDMATPDGKVHALLPFDVLQNVTVATEPIAFNLDSDISLSMVPFIRDKKKLLDAIESVRTSAAHRILLAHAYTNELMKKHTGRPGDIDAAELIKTFDIAFLGHHHVHDIVVSSGRTVVSIGAPIQHTFGDRGQVKGMVVYDTDEEEMTLVPIDDFPKFMEVSPHELPPRGAVRGNFVSAKAESKEQAESMKAFLIEQSAESIDIEIIPAATESRIKLSSKMTDDQIFNEYFQSEWGKTELNFEELTAMVSKFSGRAHGLIPF